MLEGVGLVAIGRNEGERLRRCLQSISEGVPVVYVDSGSSDGSVAFAHSVGAEVVELDMTRPFTAARARNEGYHRLREGSPDLRFVQFVDGDCELEAGWMDRAVDALENNKMVAAVCGRRRERFPEASFYNRLCDEEWNTPIGMADACGGDAMLRAEAFDAVDGYDPAMVAGEEPEMCHRLRSADWTIRRIGAPMTIHDADMHHFRQWWLRAIRSGFGYAQAWRVSAAKDAPPLYRREVLRALFWTLGVALIGLLATALFWPWGLFVAPAIWAAQLARLGLKEGGKKGAHLLIGKLAETIGIGRYALAALRGRSQGAIFYK